MIRQVWNESRALVAVALTTALVQAEEAPRAPEAQASEAAKELPVPVEAASRAQTTAAVKLYRQGLEHFEKADYEKALSEFQGSLDQVDSPNSRLMVARCLDKLGRATEAFHELQRVLREATALSQGVKKYESTRDAAASELAQLRHRVAIVHLDVDGRVTLNGTEIERANQPALVLEPGDVTLALALENGERVERKLTLAAGSEETISLRLPNPAPPAAEAPEPPPPTIEYRKDPNAVDRKTLGYVGLGVAGAGGVGFAVFGLLDKNKFESIDERCDEGLCPADLRDDVETGRLYQTAANVSLGVGAVGLATGLYFLLTSSSVDAHTDVEASASSTEVAVGPSELLVRGRF